MIKSNELTFDQISQAGFAMVTFTGGFVLALGAAIFTPVMAVAFGAFGGLLVQLAPTGDWIIQGTTAMGLHMVREQIWQVAAALSWVGSYLRYSPNVKPMAKKAK